MKIKVLPDALINQIAAGEVVERPASVVRELVDNAIDAGATEIFVALDAGGHTRIKVRDNGCGMVRDEAVLAFERHATSKVAALEDLARLSTLGFRGEALASIAAVSKVKLRTRAQEQEVGTELTIRGGKLVDVQSCAWNEGTEIEIEHLFFNTPARRKFLKSPRAEMAKIRTWLAHSALARPDVRYRLVSDGDEVLNLPKASSVEERARAVFPSDLMPVRLEESGVRVGGMVGHPGQALGDASGLVILVNGRLVSDKLVLRAIREGYDSMLKDREFPTGYIAVHLDPEGVDVNVHPQKSEVRFRHPQQIFAVVRGAVLAGVRAMKHPMGASSISYVTPTPDRLVPESSLARSSASLSSVTKSPEVSSPAYSARTLFDSVDIKARSPDSGDSAVTRQVAESLPRYEGGPEANTEPEKIPGVIGKLFRFSNLRYIGQALECYLLCEYDNHLVVVDMHAAHERVNYNKIRRARAERGLAVQKLLIPETVRLTPEQVVFLMEQREILEALAFEVAQVGEDSVVVHGVPGAVAHVNCTSLVKELASEPVVLGWRERIEERIDHMAARVACHASVRSGDALSRHEAYALFAQLDETELAGACPHGRPVVAQFTRDAVERWFGRDR